MNHHAVVSARKCSRAIERARFYALVTHDQAKVRAKATSTSRCRPNSPAIDMKIYFRCQVLHKKFTIGPQVFHTCTGGTAANPAGRGRS
jgi:hypothetical protein